MSDLYIKKNGLLYSPDGQTVVGVDDTSPAFKGRVPFGAHYIDDEIFTECPYEAVYLPDSVKKIGKALFRDSPALEKVKLPSLVKVLPEYLFAGCGALEKITMPNELEGFSEGLFMDCQSLQEIPFRNGIKVLPKKVFAGCVSLKSLVIPNTVEIIESNAAANCTGLESLVIPDSVKEIASDAFVGCTSLHNIRINGQSNIFYIDEEDGCLYKKADGGDELIIKAYKVTPSSVNYFEDNVDDKPIEEADEDEEPEDQTFSPEIGVSEFEGELQTDGLASENLETDSIDQNNLVQEPEELAEDSEDEFVEQGVGISESENDIMELTNEDNINNDVQGDTMSDESNIDSMLADIMGEEKERIAAAENVGVSEKESEALSETISVMEEDAPENNGTVSQSELEQLFSKNEEQEIAAQVSEEDKDPSELDSKTKILVDSVSKSEILNFEPKTDDKSDGDLFVIAEKLITTDSGEDFSTHLVACCKKMADIHDFRRVVLLYGLPLDNDEFMQFYRHFIGKKNIILACEADRPSKLSDYCKTVCENSRISLEKNELVEQRKCASVKSETLVKLVIRDNYEV